VSSTLRVGVRLVDRGSGGIRATERVQHREVVDDPRLPSGAHVDSRLEQLARQGLALVAQHLSCGLRLRDRAAPVDNCQQRAGVVPRVVPLYWRCTASRSLLEPVTLSTAVALSSARVRLDPGNEGPLPVDEQGKGSASDSDAVRLRGVIVVLWRAGLRISEALALTESDLNASRGAVRVRRGNGGKRREVGMDGWGWEHLEPWLQIRARLPVGALFCVLRGATRGRPCDWRA